MEKWKIKIKTLKASSGGIVFPGEIYDEDADIAQILINSGQAELISKPIQIETANINLQDDSLIEISEKKTKRR